MSSLDNTPLPLRVMAPALLALVLFINPLPLGSNRDWAWPVLAMTAFAVLGLLLLFAPSRMENWRRVRSVLWLVVLWLLMQLIYLVPWPLDLLQLLNSRVADAYRALGLTRGYLALDVHAAWLHCLQSAYYAGVFLWVLSVVQRRQQVRWLLILIVLTGLLQALYGMYLVSVQKTGLLFSDFAVTASSASGTFVNRNHYVAYLALSTLAALALRISFKRSSPSGGTLAHRLLHFFSNPMRLLDAVILIMLAGLLSSHSRAGVASFVVAAGFFVIMRFAVFAERFNPRRWLLVGGVLLLIAVPMFWQDAQVLLASLGLGGDDVDVWATERWVSWQQILTHWSENGWLGVGGGGYPTFFVNHRIAAQTHFFDHAHNDYLEFLIEFGVLSLWVLLMLAVIMALLVKRLTQADRHQLTLILTAISAVLNLMLHGLFDFNARIPANVVLLMVLLALPFCVKRRRRKRVRSESEV